MTTLAQKAAGLAGFLARPAGWLYATMVVGASLGIACVGTRGGFAVSWWLATTIAVFAAWLMISALFARDAEHALVLLRKTATAVSPLTLLCSSLLIGMHGVPPNLTGLARSWALGGTVGMLLINFGRRPLVPSLQRLRAVVAAPGTVWVVAGLWAAAYGTLSLRLWWTLAHRSPDLAIYEQAIHNTLRGRFLAYSLDSKFDQAVVSRFADHFEPTVLAFVPIYALWPTAAVFLLGQVIVLASGAVPVARLAARWYGDGAAGTAMAAAYLLHPGLHAALTDEFHMSVLAAPLILWGIHLALQRRYGWSTVMMVLALGCKENVPGTVAMVGLYLAVRCDRRFGLALATGAVLWGVMALWVIIPHFSPTGEMAYPDLLTALPGQIETETLTKSRIYWAVRLSYVIELVGPVAGVCFFAPLALAASGPELVLHFFSRIFWMRMLQYHYHVEILVGVMLAGAAGLAWLAAKLSSRYGGHDRAAADRVRAAVLVGFVVASLCFISHRGGTITGSPRERFYVDDRQVQDVHQLLALVPESASVLVNTGGLASHLARRQILNLHSTPRSIEPETLIHARDFDYIVAYAEITPEQRLSIEMVHGLARVGQAGSYYVWRVIH